MLYSENGSNAHALSFPVIALGKNVPGCRHNQVRGKHTVRQSGGGAICRVNGMDFQFDIILAQNLGPMRVGIRSILLGTSLDATEIDLRRLQEIIQRSVQLLLPTTCSLTIQNGKEHETKETILSLKSPLATSPRHQSSTWQGIELAEKMEFNIAKGDHAVFKIESVDFIDAQSSSAPGFSKYEPPKNS